MVGKVLDAQASGREINPQNKKLSMLAHTCDPRAGEAEKGGSCSLPTGHP